MSELSQRLAALQSCKQPSAACRVGRLLDELDKSDRELLVSLLALPHKQLSTRQLHAELKAGGVVIGRDTVDNHRKGWCACNVTV